MIKNSKVLKAIANEKRVIILFELMNGMKTSGEIAKLIQVEPQTCSYHLNLLFEANLVGKYPVKSNVYFKIDKLEVARFLENLLVIMDFSTPYSYGTVVCDQEKKIFRTCFDHFAGKLAILIKKELEGKLCFDWSEKDYHIGGELGRVIYTFFETNKLAYKTDRGNLKMTKSGKLFIES